VPPQREQGIPWCDETWNPVRGCTRVSRGCEQCYAEKIAARFCGEPGSPFYTFARQGPARWTGKVELVPEKLEEPIHWRKPRRVFVNSMSDLFHERLSNEDIAAVFGVMGFCSHLTFQVLTKRPERMKRWFEWLEGKDRPRELWRIPPALFLPANVVVAPGNWPLPNVWLGVSVEDQTTADARIPVLLETPAALRFVSYEPALGPVDFEREAPVNTNRGPKSVQPLYCAEANGVGKLGWIIVGGESGPKARPFDVARAFSVVEQCRRAGVPCFVKQLGAYPILDPRYVRPGATRRLRDRAGADPSEWPEDLRVREFPEVHRG